jgi:hypothetical protein
MNAPRPDGGPAFPVVSRTGDASHAGMSLRAYLIASAPREPQPWFRPECRPKPEGADQEALDQWSMDWLRAKYLQWPGAWADEQLKTLNGGGNTSDRLDQLADALFRAHSELGELYRTFGPSIRTHALMQIIERVLRAEGIQL